MNEPQAQTRGIGRFDGQFVEMAVRLGLLGFLIYWSYVLVRPFIPILVWSIVLAVALAPVHSWLALRLGGRRGPAAVLLTVLMLLVVIGPATWLAISLFEALRAIAERVATESLAVPPPPASIKSWPLFGAQAFDLWQQAYTNLSGALAKITPHLKPFASTFLSMATSVGTGVLTFLASVIITGFLFVPGPRLVRGIRAFAEHVFSDRGEEFVALAGATIRTVSRGVIGVSVAQALLAGIGFLAADVPAAGLLTFLVMTLAIIQIGATPIIIPAIIWAWMTMDTTAAVLFTAYMLPVNLVDNVLRPLAMGHGLRTPILVILIGVLGGTIAHGILGLFVGPVVLAVAWELLAAWMRDEKAAPAADAGAQASTKPAMTDINR
jgi:predicted PurR-regulated permease PerM